METFEYKFVDVKRQGVLALHPEGDYQSLITNHGREGWRLVQIFNPVVARAGTPAMYTFIFERRVVEDGAK